MPTSLLNGRQAEQVENRITYFFAYYDQIKRLGQIAKMAYSEIELEHRYQYDETDTLRRAEIIDIVCDTNILTFD